MLYVHLEMLYKNPSQASWNQIYHQNRGSMFQEAPADIRTIH